MDEWISCKDRLPPDNILVWAKNPYISSLSWIDGVDEIGKRSWCHENWSHADQFVTHWRFLSDDEVAYNVIHAGNKSKWFVCGCRIKARRDIDER